MILHYVNVLCGSMSSACALEGEILSDFFGASSGAMPSSTPLRFPVPAIQEVWPVWPCKRLMLWHVEAQHFVLIVINCDNMQTNVHLNAFESFESSASENLSHSFAADVVQLRAAPLAGWCCYHVNVLVDAWRHFTSHGLYTRIPLATPLLDLWPLVVLLGARF